MSRLASHFPAVAALALSLTASGLMAQPTPTPTPGPTPAAGPWSSGHQLWFDLNGDGTPQANELMGYPRQEPETDCTRVVGLPTGIPGTGTETPCMVVYEDGGLGGSRTRPDGMTQSFMTNETGTSFAFSQQVYTPLSAASGMRALATSASGTGDLLDLNGDGIFDSLQVQGTGVPQTRMTLMPRDVTGDGRPDYITLPWTTSGAGLLGVTIGSTPQFYAPLADSDGDGWPDTILIQVANGQISTTTGPPLSGSALANGVAIPSASTLGLFVFAAAVVAFGVKLLRGTIVAA